MYRFTLLLSAVILAGCTNSFGNDVRLEQPFILSNQHWQITDQGRKPNGDRSCSVAANELEVTLRKQGHNVLQQVATIENINPGDSYKVLFGNHIYETQAGWFNAADSQAIIQLMLTNDVVYTERRVMTIRYWHAGPDLRSVDNKIPLDNFGAQYHACEQYLKSRK